MFLAFFSLICILYILGIWLFLCFLDVDEDGKLTEEEFSDPTMNEVPDYMTEEQFRLDRINEFKIADLDKNGKVERKELLVSCY